MNWRAKALTQHVLSALPGGRKINFVLQRTIGELSDLPRYVRSKIIGDWFVQLRYLQEIGVRPEGLQCLEIGTGWIPILPICYYLAGAARCDTFDLTNLLSQRFMPPTMSELGELLVDLAVAANQPLDRVQTRYDAIKHLATPDIFTTANIVYSAPADASKTGLTSSSLDIIFSNSVLEHVSRTDIPGLMKEAHRLLRPGGVMVHGIACNDHYAFVDRNITPVNYLRYSDREWSLWNPRLQYNNRLRASEFREFITTSGFDIVLWKTNTRLDLIDSLADNIANEFRHFSQEDLCTTSVDVIARKL